MKARRLTTLDAVLLALLILGLVLLGSAKSAPYSGFDKAAYARTSGEELTDSLSYRGGSGRIGGKGSRSNPTSLSLLATPVSDQAHPETLSGPASGQLAIPTLTRPRNFTPTVRIRSVRSAAVESDLAAYTAACGGASFANLSHTLLGDGAIYPTSPTVRAQTVKRRGRFAGEARPRLPFAE